MTRIAGALPKGDRNGLVAVSGRMIEEPHGKHVAIVVFDCKSVAWNADTGDKIPTARILRIEVVRDRLDLEKLETLLRRALETRTGATVLPLDLEDEISELFAEIDLRDDQGGEADG